MLFLTKKDDWLHDSFKRVFTRCKLASKMILFIYRLCIVFYH